VQRHLALLNASSAMNVKIESGDINRLDQLLLGLGDSRSRVLKIGGANDKLRGSAEGEAEPAVQGIVKLETKRNVTGTGFLAPRSR
jgi:hypothetical protein